MSSWAGVVIPWTALAGTAWAGSASHALAGAGIPEGAGVEGAGLVLVDERCPGLSADVVRRVVASADEATVAVGVRPVTDTVKTLQQGYVGPTVDRDALVAVCSPVVLPPGLVDRARSADLADLDDLAALVARLLGEGVPVRFVEVPAQARRVADVGELALLAP